MTPKSSPNYTNHPPVDVDLNEGSELITKELMQLNFQDRINISEEIHGVRNMSVPETPLVQDEALEMLKVELNQIPSSEKTAFEVAQGLTRTYVNDDKFQLRFLRAELFDIKAAAKRITAYLDLIFELFGIEVLKRPLRTTDFNGKKEKNALRGGLVQLLPYRDRSGRRIMVILSDIMSHCHITRVKIFLYLLTVAAECEETQQKGIVFVLWPGTERTITIPQGEARTICRRSFSAFPLRVVSFHFCWPSSPLFHFVKNFFVLVMGSRLRVRVNFHSGERQELSYKLMGFGIPVQVLPTTESGVIKTKNHMQWFKTRQFLEKQAGSNATTTPGELYSAIECPTLYDVLYERNKPCIFHPGNSRFKGLIEAKKEEHALLTQTGKRDFSWSIVREVEKHNGRFLTWDPLGFWIPLLDRSEIRLKVATSLRDFNKHTRAINKCQTIPSVCKVKFDGGPELKKRRVVITDDESSRASNSETSSLIGCGVVGGDCYIGNSVGGGCLSFFSHKTDGSQHVATSRYPVDDNHIRSFVSRSA